MSFQEPAVKSEESEEIVGWYVPITYSTSDSSNFDDTSIAWLLPSENLILEDALDTTNSWLIVNSKQTGN